MKTEQDRLITESVRWGAIAGEVIREVGGSPVAVLNQFSPESIITMHGTKWNSTEGNEMSKFWQRVATEYVTRRKEESVSEEKRIYVIVAETVDTPNGVVI